jgi:hypothetical protein
MTDQTGAPAGGEAVSIPAQDTGGSLTLREAAQALANERYKPKEAPVEQPQADPVEQPELAEASSDQPEADPAEVTKEAEPEENLPPIEPPRSWTKAEKERFQSLPRETQEYLHTREQEREREFRRSQNEIAEQRKAVEAMREAADKARQQYEAKLPEVMQTINETGPFSDIRSMADVEKLQAEDPFRFQAYQLHQWKLQAVQAELVEAEKRQSQERQSQWTQHVQKENELAAEYIPELADKVKGPALTSRVATELLPELGFKDSELAALASGKEKLSIYDHRVQRLLADSIKLRDIQKAKAVAVPKDAPPVQRPGTSKPQGSTESGTIQALRDKFNKTGSLRDAQALHAAESRASRRAS